jgi:DNA-3-methyladenine glycosylase II
VPGRPTFTYRPSGAFSLAAAKAFLNGFPAGDPPPGGDDDLVWAFLTDEGEPAAVRVRQTARAVVADVIEGDVDRDRLRAQVGRLLSLDVDGAPYEAIEEPVIARLRAEHPGLRPVLFPTPYEAAVWAVLSQRTQRLQAGNVRRWLADHHGTTFTIDGAEHRTMIPPERLADLRHIPGVPGPKLPWLRHIARSALEGDLDPEHLLGLAPDEAIADLQRIDGIGRFSAELILVRGAGHPDVFPRSEPLLGQLMVQRYGLADPKPADLARVAEAWTPRRSWASFLLRSTG